MSERSDDNSVQVRGSNDAYKGHLVDLYDTSPIEPDMSDSFIEHAPEDVVDRVGGENSLLQQQNQDLGRLLHITETNLMFRTRELSELCVENQQYFEAWMRVSIEADHAEAERDIYNALYEKLQAKLRKEQTPSKLRDFTARLKETTFYLLQGVYGIFK